MAEYTDHQFTSIEWLIQKVIDESQHQVEKWGVQTHTAFEWLTYTTEELGELAQAISEHEYRGASSENVIAEAIQVATLAMKIAEMYHLDGRVSNR